ncbi:MAG: aspartate:alanine exchanger family transporter [Candidatus Methylacidiphilales bacterium]
MNNPVVIAILGNPLIALFLIIGCGLALGRLTWGGVGLGSSAVLFLALCFGHWGYSIPAGVGTFGLALFVYCVGIAAGGRFFSSLKREGSRLAFLSLIIVATGAMVAYLGARWCGLSADLAAGMFAGALTSTPALAAANEALKDTGHSALVIGYGIAYPFGVVGVVLFVQILPRVLKINVHEETIEPSTAEQRVETALVEVTNPNLFGKRISESGIHHFNACQVSRVFRQGSLVPLSYSDVFDQGQILFLVGKSREIASAIDLIGHRSEARLLRDVENERQNLLVTSKDIIGKSLRELMPLKNYGVVITRVHRLGLEFVPNAETLVESNDMLTVVGDPDSITRFGASIGHRASAIGETDLLSLSLGLALGIILGIMPIALPGGEPITLGLAGGPLLVGLLLGHVGRVGRIVGHIPRATRVLLQELGLVLFLADAGIKGGGSLVETVMQQGWILFVVGLAVTLIPLLVGYLVAVHFLRIKPLQALGGICGGMTSTPALGAITARTESQTPVVSYATAYPVALILMTLLAKILIGFLI